MAVYDDKGHFYTRMHGIRRLLFVEYQDSEK
jgi:hypothetical protein